MSENWKSTNCPQQLLGFPKGLVTSPENSHEQL